MNHAERQQLLKRVCTKMQKTSAFIKAMQDESVTRGTALTLLQLAEDAQSDAAALLRELGGDTRPKL